MRYTIDEIEINDIVTVNSNFGMGPVVVGIVDNIEADIKGGIPGIDYHHGDNGATSWAYIDQVIRVDHVPVHTVKQRN